MMFDRITRRCTLRGSENMPTEISIKNILKIEKKNEKRYGIEPHEDVWSESDGQFLIF